MDIMPIQEIRKKCSMGTTFSRGRIIYENEAVSLLTMKKNGSAGICFHAEVIGNHMPSYEVELSLGWQAQARRFKQEKEQCQCMAFARYGFCKHLVAVSMKINERISPVEAQEFLEKKQIGETVVCVSQQEEEKLFAAQIKNIRDWEYQEMINQTRSREQLQAVRNEVVATSSGRVFSGSAGFVRAGTSPELMGAMTEAATWDRNQFCRQDGLRDVRLEVTLTILPDEERLSLHIGRKKMYVVKNIRELVENVRQQKYVRYGKELEFIHVQSAFSREARILLSILESIIMIGSEEYWSRERVDGKRYLKLEQWMLDEILGHCVDDTILVENANDGRNTRLFIRRENPVFPIQIRRKKREIWTQVFFPDILLLEGVQKQYVVWEDAIYVCSQEYSQNLRGLLPLMARNYTRRERENMSIYSHSRNQMKHKRHFQLSEREYTTFTNTLLPVLEKYTVLEVEGIDFSEYEPEEGSYQVYLDLAPNKGVSCRAIVRYGEREHNLFQSASMQETYRDIRTEYELRTLLMDYFPEASEDSDFYLLHGDDDRLAELVEQGIERLRELAEVFVSEGFRRIRVARHVTVTAGLSVVGDLMNVSWDVTGMSQNELYTILKEYRRKKKYYRLKSGELLNLRTSGLDVLADIQEELHLNRTQMNEGSAELPMYHSLYLDKLLTENSDRIVVEREESFLRQMKCYEEVRTKQYPIPEGLCGELRQYQKDGYQWACSLAELGFGGVLADDMGLGKTLQMIAYLCHAKGRLHLVVAPASLVYNWEAEFHRFAPEMAVRLIVGNAEERKELLQTCGTFDVIITSYDLLRRDIAIYDNLEFGCEVIDEAQYIKNPSTQVAKAVKSVRSRVRFALTGTPIENRLSELWSIFEYIMPGYLFRYSSFRETFEDKILNGEKEECDRVLYRLHRMISPFLLRRLKKEVLKDLPQKVEEVKYTRFDSRQEELYRAGEKKILISLQQKSGKEVRENKLQILAELTKLRQICCDPSLLYDNYKGGSAKLDTCMQIIKSASEGGHRVLLFSQFTTMLQILSERLSKERIGFFLLTGKTTKRKRKEIVDRFQAGEAEVFLISLKAGGTGLNLTAADVVIHYDPWWNVAAQNQATDRTHRIGQENPVTVIRLIARDTIEERILKLQEKKQDLANKVISAEGVSAAVLSKEELMELFER